MDGGGHDVAGGEAVLHHVGVYGVGVAAVVAVQLPGPPVGRQHQPAGAAGVVGDVVILQRLGVAPVQVFGDGQKCRQGGAFRAGVIGGQGLPVGNQPLEHRAGHVVLLDGLLDVVGSSGHAVQQARGDGGRDEQQQLFGDVKNRPVVDGQDVVPLGNDVVGMQAASGLAHLPQALDDAGFRAPVNFHRGGETGQVLLEGQRVYQHGGGHLGRLLAGVLVGLFLLQLCF